VVYSNSLQSRGTYSSPLSPLRPQDLLESVQAEFPFGQAVTLKAAVHHSLSLVVIGHTCILYK